MCLRRSSVYTCMHVSWGLTHPGGGRDRGRAAAGQPAPRLYARPGSRWWHDQCSPVDRRSLGCSASSSWPRYANPWWNKDSGLCRYAWCCPCACGWCSWLWAAGRMCRRMTSHGASWMSFHVREGQRWHLKERLYYLTACSFMPEEKLQRLSKVLSRLPRLADVCIHYQAGLTFRGPYCYFTQDIDRKLLISAQEKANKK